MRVKLDKENLSESSKKI